MQQDKAVLDSKTQGKAQRSRVNAPLMLLVPLGWALFIISGVLGADPKRLSERVDLVLLCLGPALMGIGLIARRFQAGGAVRKKKRLELKPFK